VALRQHVAAPVRCLDLVADRVGYSPFGGGRQSSATPPQTQAVKRDGAPADDQQRKKDKPGRPDAWGRIGYLETGEEVDNGLRHCSAPGDYDTVSCRDDLCDEIGQPLECCGLLGMVGVPVIGAAHARDDVAEA
jgi:hypothetical protein